MSKILALLAGLVLCLGAALISAAPAGAIGSAWTICNNWKPHTGDHVEDSFYYFMNEFVVRTQCRADDPNYSGDHFYCVNTYVSDGHETWVPNCISGYS